MNLPYSAWDGEYHLYSHGIWPAVNGCDRSDSWGKLDSWRFFKQSQAIALYCEFSDEDRLRFHAGLAEFVRSCVPADEK